MDVKSNYLNYPKVSPLLNQLITMLEKDFGEELISVALFGSVARGSASSASDVDLFIVHRQGTKRIVNDFSRVTLAIKASKEYLKLENEGFLPDPFPVFADEIKLKEHPWILLDIVDDGIILFDKGNILKTELELLRNTLRLLGSKKIMLENGSWYWDLKPDWKPGEVIKL